MHFEQHFLKDVFVYHIFRWLQVENVMSIGYKKVLVLANVTERYRLKSYRA